MSNRCREVRKPEAEQSRVDEVIAQRWRETNEIQWTALVDVITDVAEMSKRWRS